MAKDVPNGEATQFRSGDEAAKMGSKGGKASGVARRKKSQVMDIVKSLLDKKVKNDEKASELAQKYGIDDAKTVKDLYVAVCLYNSTSAQKRCQL